ncbi:MAG TPA: hypothetical protein VGR55_05705 [Candidatus Acidoferrum sp.]|nr:hypothetical protein [Candidatus Acidoferrum sp.]
MKIVASQIDLHNGRITIDGRDVFGDLLKPKALMETAQRQESFTKSLPEEDTRAGHVIPASIVTVAGSS